MSQLHLHSENFDLCRVCLLEPESNRNVKFVHIFTAVQGQFVLKTQLEELLGIKVEANDVKPKMICENCYNSLLSWDEMRKKAAESNIVINYIAVKKFGATNTGTSMEFNSSQTLSVTTKQSITHTVNINDPCCSSSISSSYCKQDSSSRSLVINNSKSEYVGNESDDCVVVQDQIETIELSSDDEDSEESDDGSIEFVNEYTIDASDNKFINNDVKNYIENYVQNNVQNDVKNEFVYTSNNEESADNSFHSDARDQPGTSGYRNDENEKLYYCSICQKKDFLSHDCSQYNKNFSTCLVPNCHVLSRSKEDFLPHYQLHTAMSPSAVMCNRCYQEMEESDQDVNGYHRNGCTVNNIFKCYTCNVIFNNMAEFAYHKLKKHNGRLMDSLNNYLCLYCDQYSSELSDIIDHKKECLESQSQTGTTIRMKIIIPSTAKKNLLSVMQKKKVQRKRRSKKTVAHTSKMILFTCLKPSCDLIFQTFTIFKNHYREHFELGKKLVCWQCCKAFNDLNGLRSHQVRDICCTPGMFKCNKCSKKFDDIQSLSIHKYTYHDGILMANKKNNKTIECAFCKSDIIIFNFQRHLNSCKKKNYNKNTDYLKNIKGTYQCKFCIKIFHSVVSLSNHMRSHKSE